MTDKHVQPSPNKLELTIGWLYPELMSTYGDRGNILVLKKRCEWRGIEVTILPITESLSATEMKGVDLLFGGGAQDTEQGIVMNDLIGKKGQVIKELIEKNVPSLFVCGSPQLMGRYYEPSVGERIEGLGIFDMVTTHPGEKKKRLIGNTVGKILWKNFSDTSPTKKQEHYIVGFENHGGRTTLGKNALPFATVIKGYGNNGEDKTEGVAYKNAIGCYYHGPLLPKNPHLADWLIKTALELKYQKQIELSPLDDTLEYLAQSVIAKRLGVTI